MRRPLVLWILLCLAWVAILAGVVSGLNFLFAMVISPPDPFHGPPRVRFVVTVALESIIMATSGWWFFRKLSKNSKAWWPLVLIVLAPYFVIIVQEILWMAFQAQITSEYGYVYPGQYLSFFNWQVVFTYLGVTAGLHMQAVLNGYLK